MPTLLCLDQVSEHAWVGPNDTVRLPQLFGGQLVAQSLVAAGRSVPDDRVVTSILTTFLRPGRTDEPVTYEVEDLRSGRRLSTRDVRAWQGERLVCRSTVTCAVEIDGISHSRPAPSSAGAAASTDIREIAAADGGLGEFWDGFAALDIRIDPVDHQEDDVPHAASAPHRIWMRTAAPLGDDPLLHRAMIAYCSDLMLMSTAVSPHGHTAGHERSLTRNWRGVSLDHSLWFHRPLRADEWFLIEQVTPTAHGGRALITAAAFDPAGEVAVHITQEALIQATEPEFTEE